MHRFVGKIRSRVHNRAFLFFLLQDRASHDRWEFNFFVVAKNTSKNYPKVMGKRGARGKLKSPKKIHPIKQNNQNDVKFVCCSFFLLRHRRGKPIFWMRVCKCVRLCLTKVISNIGPEIECERECGGEEGELKNNTKKLYFFPRDNRGKSRTCAGGARGVIAATCSSTWCTWQVLGIVFNFYFWQKNIWFILLFTTVCTFLLGFILIQYRFYWQW